MRFWNYPLARDPLLVVQVLWVKAALRMVLMGVGEGEDIMAVEGVEMRVVVAAVPVILCTVSLTRVITSGTDTQ